MERYKLNKLKKEQWLEAYKNSGSFTSACQSVRIGRKAVYDLIKADKRFAEKKDEVDNLVNDIVENRLFALTRINPTACIFWLCNRRSDKWKNLNETKHHFNKEIEESLDKISRLMDK